LSTNACAKAFFPVSMVCQSTLEPKDQCNYHPNNHWPLLLKLASISFWILPLSLMPMRRPGGVYSSLHCSLPHLLLSQAKFSQRGLF
jgi:hypothetical protein